MSESDDELSLCPTTISALQEFLKEKEKREKQLTDVFQSNQLLDVSFEEDWVINKKLENKPFYMLKISYNF